MKYPLTFRRKAKANIRAIHDWYESQREGLGEEFLEDLDNACENLRKFPMMHALISKRVRRTYTNRFPYSIFYYLEDDEVIVLTCQHMHQHPNSWPQF